MNAQWAHIKNLRSRLGVHGELLETVRGVGYRLNAGREGKV
jgi:DNA-binding response OmpR family regulator